MAITQAASGASERGRFPLPEHFSFGGREGGVGFRDLVPLLRRRIRLLLGTVILGTAGAALAALGLPDVYSASATVVLERNDTRLLEPVAEIDLQEPDRSAIETEMRIMTSRLFVGRVVDSFGLINDPRFNPYLPRPDEDNRGLVQNAVGWTSDFLARLRGLQASSESAETPVTAELERVGLPPIAKQRERTISTLISQLSVTRFGESFALLVRVSSGDGELAASLANAIATIYVEGSLELKQNAISSTVAFLRERAAELVAEISEGEAEVAAYSQENRLATATGDDLLRAQMTQLNAGLIDAWALHAENQARLERLRSVLDAGEEVAGTILTSPLITTLQTEESELVRERAQLALEFGRLHPRIQDLDAQIGSVRKMIHDETQRLVFEQEIDVDVLQARVSQFEAEIAQLDDDIRSRDVAGIGLRALERDLAGDQLRYEQVLERLGNLDRQEEVLKPSARVISEADVPGTPASPKRNVIIVGGFLGSAALAVILALMLEAFQTRLRSGDRAVQIARLPVLAEVPRVRKRLAFRARVSTEVLVRRRNSPFAESMRTLYLALRTMLPSDRGRVIMLTSAHSLAGVTTLAVGLAIAARADARRILLVDLTGSRKATEIARNRETLASYFDGRTPLGELPRNRPNLGGMDVLSMDGGIASSGVSSDQLQSLLEGLRAQYDLVVVDAPPALLTNDAAWLGPMIDATILLVRSGHTKEDALRDAVSRLYFSQTPLLGLVLNGAEPATLRRRRGRSLAAIP